MIPNDMLDKILQAEPICILVGLAAIVLLLFACRRKNTTGKQPAQKNYKQSWLREEESHYLEALAVAKDAGFDSYQSQQKWAA